MGGPFLPTFSGTATFLNGYPILSPSLLYFLLSLRKKERERERREFGRRRGRSKEKKNIYSVCILFSKEL